MIHNVHAGDGQIALIAGETGIGKSRLLDEIKSLARSLHFVTLEGTCLEPDRTLPFAPFIDLLRSFYTTNSSDEISRALVSISAELASLLPELAVQLRDMEPASSIDPKLEKQRLFESLVQFFFRLTEDAPLLIILEDLHWSDNHSLDFLLYFIHRMATQPILLLLSFRNEEIHQSFQHFLAMLKRDRRAIEILLNPLTIEEVDGMIREIFELPRPVHAEFLDKIYRLTEGNPFFVEEVLKFLITDGEIYYENGFWKQKPLGDLQIPLSVQDAVQQRMRRLDGAARDVLTIAAVIGQRFDFSLLQELTQLDDQELILLLKNLVEAQLVSEDSAGQFSFRHTLTREAVYATLLLLERQKYHRKIAQTMERNFSPSVEAFNADLAYHFYQGALWDKALEYSQLAGDQAQNLFAPLEAVEHFTRALKAAQAQNIAPPESLYLKRGRAYEILGDFENSLSDYQQALLSARRGHDNAVEWQSLIALGLLWSGRDYKKTGEFYRLAKNLAQELGMEEYMGRSLNCFGNWLANVGRGEESLEAHQQALEIFQSLGDQHGVAETLDLYALAMSLYGDQVEALNQFKHANTLFRDLGDKIGFVSSLASCNGPVALTDTVFPPLRTIAECKRDATQALKIAHQIHWFAEQAHAELFLGAALANYGEFGDGWLHANAALEIATEIEHHQWIAASHFVLGQLCITFLHPGLAIQHLEAGLPLARKLGSNFWVGNIMVDLALVHLLQGEALQAQAILEPMMPQNQPKHNLTERRIVWSWGQAALALDKPVEALQIAEQLIASAPGTERSRPIPALLKLKGEALMALGKLDESLSVLKEAQRGAEEDEARPFLWQIHADLAQLRHFLHQKNQARSELAEAQKIIRSLAATLEDPEQRENFIQNADSKLPILNPAFSRNGTSSQFGGLTAREQEIALLISEGKSNGEIGNALVISKRTVTTHVTHILFKLGFHSRAQIAAWVVKKNQS